MYFRISESLISFNRIQKKAVPQFYDKTYMHFNSFRRTLLLLPAHYLQTIVLDIKSSLEKHKVQSYRRQHFWVICILNNLNACQKTLNNSISQHVARIFCSTNMLLQNHPIGFPFPELNSLLHLQ